MNALFEKREQYYKNQCKELQERIQQLINKPEEIKIGADEDEKHMYIGSYLNRNCDDVKSFVERHNEDHPQMQISISRVDKVSHVKATIDDKKKTLIYHIY